MQLKNIRTLLETVIEEKATSEDKDELIFRILRSDEVDETVVPIKQLANVASKARFYDAVFLPRTSPKYKELVKLTGGKDGWHGPAKFVHVRDGILWDRH